MKQLVILSGKGGTGKTSVAAAFAHLAQKGQATVSAVLADADVDAANLELVLAPVEKEKHEFYGGSVAQINQAKCEACGICANTCRFDAIDPAPQAGIYQVNAIACEGCAACLYQCPTGAVKMVPQLNGYWYRSESRYGPLIHAALTPGQENSGKLVTLVKQRARLLAMEQGYQAVITDGPPGIGCPVISAASGADLAVIVAEPTAAGIHDMARVLDTTAHFGVQSLVCINKADLYWEGAAQIEALCRDRDIILLGKIPFDPSVTEAMVNGEPVTAYWPDAPASQAIDHVWRSVAKGLSVP